MVIPPDLATWQTGVPGILNSTLVFDEKTGYQTSTESRCSKPLAMRN